MNEFWELLIWCVLMPVAAMGIAALAVRIARWI